MRLGFVANYIIIKLNYSFINLLFNDVFYFGLDGGIEEVTQDKLRHIRKEIRNSNNNIELDNCLENDEQAILNTFLVW